MLRAPVLALALSGCSFVFVSGPPSPPPPPPAQLRCTTASTAPIIDTAVAVLAAIGAVYFATSDGDRIGLAVESTISLGFAASAVTGFRRIGRCNTARASR